MRLPLLGDYLALRRDPFGFYTSLQRDQGDVATFRMGPMDAVLVSDPQLATDVLQRDLDRYRKGFGNDVLEPLIGGGLFLLEGEGWKPRRRLIQPLLSLERLRALLPAFRDQVRTVLESWERTDEPLALYARLRPAVLRAMGAALLGTKAMEDRATQEAMNTLWLSTNRRLWHIAGWMDRLPLPENRAFERALRVLRPIVEETRDHAAGPLVPSLKDAGLSPEDLDAEILTFLIAGQECTAIAAAWALHLVARDPESQRSLRNEVDGTEDEPDFDTLWSLKLLRGTLDESLRMFPPAWMIARQANHSHELGSCPVKKDSVVMVCPYIVHRHPGHWDAPEEFQPGRSGPRTTPRAFLPFGTGPRTCVGANLARIIATTTVFETLRRYDLEAVGRPRPAPMLTLRPESPLWTRVRKRT